jgi:cytochrome b6-f complex iron-sulfur subunit
MKMAREETQARGLRSRLDRRSFMAYGLWAAAVALIVEGGVVTIQAMRPLSKPAAFGSKFEAGNVEDLEVGSITYFLDGRFYISRLPGGLLALYRKCTHLGCVVPWRADEQSEDSLGPAGRFNCPCHGSIFDRYGVVKGGPAPRPMDTFPIEIDGGKIIVDTGTIITRSSYDESQLTKV